MVNFTHARDCYELPVNLPYNNKCKKCLDIDKPVMPPPQSISIVKYPNG
jgi:hypothetical protein